MTATPEASALHHGMHHIEKAVQQLFDVAASAGPGPATLRFEWTGGQAGASIPVAEAMTLLVSSPRGNGKRVWRQSDVQACATGVTAQMQPVLATLAGEIASA